ncbi:hypothetical protein [Gemmata massiliana]|uniref:hypothetical protein n=1 Tax=Gemmata massiliana TaxID=1210884 RepID=UPI001E4F9D74|nr:hypothetical protein [Gemmata massiliana]
MPLLVSVYKGYTVTADEWRHHERLVGSNNTEEAWLACTAADDLLSRAADLHYRRGNHELSERKLRLFGCACCRLLWLQIPAAASRAAVVAAERYADGSVGEGELAAACEAAAEFRLSTEYSKNAPTWAAASIARGVDDEWLYRTHISDIIEAVLKAIEYRPFGFDTEMMEATLCQLFRDIFGNPFRPVAFSPSWRTATAITLAAQMYESRDFGAMPILADALQDAGCNSAEVLDHCRGDGPHVRGCWIVDLVLGKE